MPPQQFGFLRSPVFTRMSAAALAVGATILTGVALLPGETPTATATPAEARTLVGTYTSDQGAPAPVTEVPSGKAGKLPTRVLPTPPPTPTPTPTYAPGDTSLFGPDPGVPQDLRGNAKYIWDALRAAGYSEAGAAGVLGNLQQESNMNPAAPGGGLAQWINARWSGSEGVVAWCTARKLDPYSLQGQTAYLLWDIKRFGATTGGTLSDYLTRATDPGDAANVFQYSFEKAGIPMMENRIRYAQSWFNEFRTK